MGHEISLGVESEGDDGFGATLGVDMVDEVVDCGGGFEVVSGLAGLDFAGGALYSGIDERGRSLDVAAFCGSAALVDFVDDAGGLTICPEEDIVAWPAILCISLNSFFAFSSSLSSSSQTLTIP